LISLQTVSDAIYVTFMVIIYVSNAIEDTFASFIGSSRTLHNLAWRVSKPIRDNKTQTMSLRSACTDSYLYIPQGIVFIKSNVVIAAQW